MTPLELLRENQPRTGDAFGVTRRSTPRSQVSVERVIGSADIDDFHTLYVSAFAPLRTRAAGRHMLHRSEFVEEMTDPRVAKFVSWDAHGRPAGLTTLTRDLSTVPWISPEYYASRYPEHAARDAVYYWGFTLTRPGTDELGHFRRMLVAALAVVEADRGICGYDICAYNNAALHLGENVKGALGRLSDISVAELDTQTYYTAGWPQLT